MTTVAVPAGVRLHPEHGAASWRAIGTYVELRTSPEELERAVELVAAVIDEVDEGCSRFRLDSDLSLVNASLGRPVLVSPVLVGAVRVALEAAHETDGLVDPTLGTVLTGAGYDRTFTLVPGDDPSPAALPVRRGSWRDVAVDDATVSVPAGAALDLGATGKAFAADLAALTVVEELGVPVLVSIGGDVRVAGPDDAAVPRRPIRLGHSLADLDAGGDSLTVSVGAGGVATSSVSARRWRRGGRQWHHLVDPRTGGPADGPWRTVTALGRTAVAANTASTAAVVLGADAERWLADRGVAARLVGHDGHVATTPAWDAAETEETL
ncbi:FAD:protein FMN transferase [Phycicoccus sonneratiae]|uniref:FAD:protein FMN transferase n=1 Tax=Phycicoccus sonneratiae TaxID=2807628 RepID=A0ABS2CKA6_9MICO|nr:FAD:protein FMN transferase [Phycicoccus sonneraticus]MBM6400311.1 FAD:protein FMN transferase [Phycicoccus sonneraticus]